MTRKLEKAPSSGASMRHAARDRSSRESGIFETPAQKRRQQKEESLKQRARDDDEGKTEGEEDEEEYENEKSDQFPPLIEVKHSRRAVTADVHSAVLAHRGSIIRRQLSLPHEHPRSSYHQTLPRTRDPPTGLGRRRRTDRIE